MQRRCQRRAKPIRRIEARFQRKSIRNAARRVAEPWTLSVTP
jgi:hypothetical protein